MFASPLFLYVYASLPVLIWIYLLLARGGFWFVPRLFWVPKASDVASGAKRVVVVIPARNEVELIGATVISLLHQTFAGSIHIIVVDDGSTDGTAEAAAISPAVTVIRGAPLPPGWSGKLWAMSQGVEAARALNPDYLLFTDADIHHDPLNVAALVANAESHDRDLVSYMVKLCTATFAERFLIPAFVFFFFKLYPPAWIASPRARTAGAAGGCMLIRPQALERMGGLESIRSEIIDDCSLARAVKRSGGRIWLGLTRETRSLRPYGSLAEIGHMISRTAFNQLHHSYALLLLTVIGLSFTYLIPVSLLLAPDPMLKWLGAAAWLLMSVAYLPMVLFYRVSPLWCVCLPLIALFYVGATIHSALQYALGRGGRWKGRVQDSRAT